MGEQLEFSRCVLRIGIFSQMIDFLTKKRSKGDQFSGKGLLEDLWIVKPALTHMAPKVSDQQIFKELHQ